MASREEKMAELLAKIDADAETMGRLKACKKHGMKAGAFHYWRKKLQAQPPSVEVTDLAKYAPKKPRAKSRGQIIVLMGDPQTVSETLRGLL